MCVFNYLQNLEAKEWVMLFSASIVVFGWFINSRLNRKHEIFKKRLDYRLKMLESYVSAAMTLERIFNPNQTKDRKELTTEFLDQLENSQTQILLFGSKSEIELINEIMTFAKQDKHEEMKNKSGQLMLLIRKNLRSELGMEATAPR